MDKKEKNIKVGKRPWLFVVALPLLVVYWLGDDTFGHGYTGGWFANLLIGRTGLSPNNYDPS